MSYAGALDIAVGRAAASRPRGGSGSGGTFPRTGSTDPVIELLRWQEILRRLGIAPTVALQLARRAKENGTGLQIELVAASAARETDVYRVLAAELGLRFQATVDPARLATGGSDALALLHSASKVQMLKCEERDGQSALLIAPERFDLEEMRGWLEKYPDIAARVRIVTPTALRNALIEKARPGLIATARDGLFVRFPGMSARMVANAWQGTMLGVAVIGLPVALAAAPGQTFLAMHVFFSLFFLACVFLRLAAARRLSPAPIASSPAMPDPARMPVYSVLVALRHEAEIVPDLLVSLGMLVWPRSKLEIKLICEADDHATIAAIGTHQLRSCVEVIEVPAGMPKTKPNALAYALPLARGNLIALYDAEDRPHPHQLVEAWRRFAADGDDLACLQAPIDIDNGHAGILPRMFAFEYSALFHGLLPFVSRNALMFPLGGTSNHFRRGALEKVGAWDPFNVTEDADLGVRLARFGYRTAMIACPTREDALVDALVWLKQRTRWLKGWQQTWLVHMRNPFELARQLGAGSFVVAQILLAGLVVSALVHPILLFSGLALWASFAIAGELGAISITLLVVDTANIALGYSAFLLLGWRALRPPDRAGFWKIVAFVPVYWLMMSAAAWRALLQLYTDPHCWEKTPHPRRQRPSGSATLRRRAPLAP